MSASQSRTRRLLLWASLAAWSRTAAGSGSDAANLPSEPVVPGTSVLPVQQLAIGADATLHQALQKQQQVHAHDAAKQMTTMRREPPAPLPVGDIQVPAANLQMLAANPQLASYNNPYVGAHATPLYASETFGKSPAYLKKLEEQKEANEKLAPTQQGPKFHTDQWKASEENGRGRRGARAQAQSTVNARQEAMQGRSDVAAAPPGPYNTGPVTPMFPMGPNNGHLDGLGAPPAKMFVPPTTKQADNANPKTFGEAQAEVSKLDKIIYNAEKKAGLDTKTTPVPTANPEEIRESEQEVNSLSTIVVMIVVCCAVIAGIYSVYSAQESRKQADALRAQMAATSSRG